LGQIFVLSIHSIGLGHQYRKAWRASQGSQFPFLHEAAYIDGAPERGEIAPSIKNFVKKGGQDTGGMMKGYR
jgi:hypothetical protein